MELWKLAEQYRADVARLQDCDLPPDAVMDTIDGMQGEVTEKIKAVMIVSMEMQKLAEARKQCAKDMADSAKAMQARADNLQAYAQIAIQNCGIALPLTYPEFTVTLAKNPPSCEVTDVNELPNTMLNTDVSFSVKGKPDLFLEAVKTALDAVGNKLVVSAPTVTVAPDKKAVLSLLKTVDAENKTRADGEQPYAIKGAHLNPTTYRIVVK